MWLSHKLPTACLAHSRYAVNHESLPPPSHGRNTTRSQSHRMLPIIVTVFFFLSYIIYFFCAPGLPSCWTIGSCERGMSYSYLHSQDRLREAAWWIGKSNGLWGQIMSLVVIGCMIFGSYGKNHFLNPSCILCNFMQWGVLLSHLTDEELHFQSSWIAWCSSLQCVSSAQLNYISQNSFSCMLWLESSNGSASLIELWLIYMALFPQYKVSDEVGIQNTFACHSALDFSTILPW